MLGAILMFALVFSLLVIVQVWGVPTANAQVEVEHNEGLEADYGQFAATLDRVAALGSSETVSLDAGVRYPSRLFLINPPPSSYTFSSSEVLVDGVTVSNVQTATIDPEADEYLTGVRGGVLEYDTQSYTLSTDYAHYQSAPTYRIEGGVMYQQFENGAVSFIDEGSVVDGQQINIVLFEGDISTGGSESLSLQASAVSSVSRPITVDDTGTPIVLTLPTELDQTAWDKLVGSQANVDDVVVDPSLGTVTITLDPDATYDLRITKIRLGTDDTPAAATYLTAASGTDVSLSGDATSLSVEVRDEFNNPRSGTTVTFEVTSGTGVFTSSATDTVTVESNQQGIATARFEPNDDTVVRASIGSGTEERVDFTVDVLSSIVIDGTDSTDLINPSTNVVLVDSEKVGGNTLDYIRMEFDNRGGTDKTITEARINFVTGAKPGGDSSSFTARLSDSTTFDTSTSDGLMTVGRELETYDIDLTTAGTTASGTTDVYLQFYENAVGDDPWNPKNTDILVVISLVYDDGTQGTYFVGTN